MQSAESRAAYYRDGQSHAAPESTAPRARPLFKRSLGMHANPQKLDFADAVVHFNVFPPVALWLQQNETAPKYLNETCMRRQVTLNFRAPHVSV